MSTYYYLVCKKHKEITPAASRSGGVVALTDSDITLMPFIISHHRCKLISVSEHDDEANDDTYTEWNVENLQQMREIYGFPKVEAEMHSQEHQ